jgi:cation:H+ antiporter
MLENVAGLIFNMVVVFVGSLLFVNAIEYLGCRFQLGGPFVSATLSPLFTSLPELIIFLVAIFSLGGISGQEIGVGTLFGQPFMASSLSYGLVGLVAIVGYRLKKRRDTVLSVSKHLTLPYIFITVLFPATLIPSLFNSSIVRYGFALLFFGAYAVYIILTARKKNLEAIEEAEKPYICRLIGHPTYGGTLQLIAAVILIYFASTQMVASVKAIAEAIGINALGLSIILIPLATAIPETTSAIIWAWRGKDTLGVGALVGEKVLFATFYPALGLLLTAWVLDIYAYVSVVATTVVSLVLLYFVYKQRIPWYAMLSGFGFFIAYAIIIFLHIV